MIRALEYYTEIRWPEQNSRLLTNIKEAFFANMLMMKKHSAKLKQKTDSCDRV